jgi:hypothetical protein
MNCMAHSFSKALGIPFAQFIELVGHDGSEKVFKDVTYGRGFHIQECIDVCYKLGYSCTEIQASFGSRLFDSNDSISLYSSEEYDSRFKDYLLKTNNGILMGYVIKPDNRRSGHAVYWNGKNIEDVRGFNYEWEYAAIHNFYPQTLWIIIKTDF